MVFILFWLYLLNGKFWLGFIYAGELHQLTHTFKRTRVKYSLWGSVKNWKKLGKKKQIKEGHKIYLFYWAMKKIRTWKVMYDVYDVISKENK